MTLGHALPRAGRSIFTVIANDVSVRSLLNLQHLYKSQINDTTYAWTSAGVFKLRRLFFLRLEFDFEAVIRSTVFGKQAFEGFNLRIKLFWFGTPRTLRHDPELYARL